MNERFQLVSDDDGHWYIVPLTLVNEFYAADDDTLNAKFDEYRTGGSPALYSFTDPQLVKP